MPGIMDTQLRDAARHCVFCQPALRELATRLPESDAALDLWIGELVAAGEDMAFESSILAALGTGRQVDARHLVNGAALFSGIGRLVSAAFAMSGDVASALVAEVAEDRLPLDYLTMMLAAAAEWCQKKGGGAYPPELPVQARILARKVKSNLPALVPLACLAEQLGDPVLRSIIQASQIPEIHRGIEAIRKGFFGDGWRSALAFVPATPPPKVLSGFTVRRAVARAGRNDPCPCGSGKKYKKCCWEKDQSRLLQSSEIAGKTVDEVWDDPEAHLTAKRVADMRPYELGRLNPQKVDPQLHEYVLDRMFIYRQYHQAAAFLEKIGWRPDVDFYWRDAMDNMAASGGMEACQRLLALYPKPEIEKKDLPFSVRLMGVDNARRVLDLLNQEALKSLVNHKSFDVTDLCYKMLENYCPALGILVARGWILQAGYLDAEMLYDLVLETRDRLRLPPEDPYEFFVDDYLSGESARDLHDSEELDQARSDLKLKSEELRKLRQKLSAAEKELEHSSAKALLQPPAPVPASPGAAEASPAPPPAAAEQPVVRELRSKVEILREELKQRHQERNELRRELQNTQADLAQVREQKASSGEPPASQDPEEDRLFGESAAAEVQALRLPEFSRRFREQLPALPPAVSRSAMALIGRLAAGEKAAFAGARRLHADRTLWRQKVGDNHRLLFRMSGPDRLEVLALVNRRDLEKAIKSLA